MANPMKVFDKQATILRTLAAGLMVLVLVSVALAASGSRMQGERAADASRESRSLASMHPDMPDPLQAWQLIIGQVMERAEPSGFSLRKGVKYLAIDADTLTGLPSENQNALFAFLENYGLQTLDKGRQELEREGYIANLTFKEGYLIEVKVWLKSFRMLEVNASLWHSGAGAYGWRGMILAYRDGRWQIEHGGGYYVA